jgi:hypothetical protein
MEVAQFELEEFKDTVNQQLGERAWNMVTH